MCYSDKWFFCIFVSRIGVLATDGRRLNININVRFSKCKSRNQLRLKVLRLHSDDEKNAAGCKPSSAISPFIALAFLRPLLAAPLSFVRSCFLFPLFNFFLIYFVFFSCALWTPRRRESMANVLEERLTSSLIRWTGDDER